jgi:hypothetical protein
MSTDVGGVWEVVVSAVNPEADPGPVPQPYRPNALRHYVLARLAVTNRSPLRQSFPTYLLHVIGPSGVAHAIFEPPPGSVGGVCTSVPNSLPIYPDIVPGATLEGTVCWAVLAPSTDGLSMFLDPAYFGPAEEPVYFQLTSAGVGS